MSKEPVPHLGGTWFRQQVEALTTAVVARERTLCPTLARISFALRQQFCLGRDPRPVVPMPSELLLK